MATRTVVPPAHVSDSGLSLKAAGLIAADTLGSTIVNLGDWAVRGDLVIDWTALEIASGDETYRIKIQGSSSATFASDVVELGSIILGDGSAIGQGGDVDDPATGSTSLPFTNVRNGLVYQYARYAIDVTGTIATGINFTARISNLHTA